MMRVGRPFQWGGRERGSVVCILSIALPCCAGVHARALVLLEEAWLALIEWRVLRLDEAQG
jgi:hypothetical protein